MEGLQVKGLLPGRGIFRGVGISRVVGGGVVTVFVGEVITGFGGGVVTGFGGRAILISHFGDTATCFPKQVMINHSVNQLMYNYLEKRGLQ